MSDNELENIKGNKFQTTKNLIEDSLSNPYTISSISAYNKKFNNTAYLLNDRTSILVEGKNSKYSNNLAEVSPRSNISFNSIIKSSNGNKNDKLIEDHDLNNSLFYDKNKKDYESLNLSESKEIKFKNSSIDKLEFSKKYLNFDITLPGQVIKRDFTIKNNTKDKINIELKFRTSELNDIFSKFEDNENIINSHNKYLCFYIQEKGINMHNIIIYPNEVCNIDIILETPFLKNKENLFSCIDVLKENKVITSISLKGYVEPPRLVCLREISGGNIPLINLKIDLKAKGQKFKIPFKNLSLVDLDIDIIIEKKFSDNNFILNGSSYQCQFYCYPNILTINSHQTATLDLIAKVTKISDENLKPIYNKIRKVLIAKVKNANVCYTFFIEATFNK